MDVQRKDLTLNATGNDVAALHQRLGALGLAVPAPEQQQAVFGSGTQEAVTQFQTAHGLPATGAVDAPTSNAIDQMVLLYTYIVSGTVSSPDRAGVGGLHVQVVDKNVGPDVPLGNAVTDQQGHYQARVVILPASLQRRQKAQPDLQVHVIAGNATLASSAVRYNASRNETLDVLLPAGATALPSEYETLTATLAAHFSGHLGDLQESGDRQDVTFLANKSGWDARAVALAALADQFSRNAANATAVPPGTASTVAPGSTEVAVAAGIKPDFYYALFRAGFPANADPLYQASPQTVSAVWQQAISQGIIPSALAGEVPGALQAFQRLGAAHALTAKPLIGISPLKDLLQLTFGTNEQNQQQFAGLYTQYQHDLPAFWLEAQKAFGPAVTKRLQLDGQLGYLTLNNAGLIGRLHDAEKQSPLGSTLDLAQRGYYQAAKWQPLLDAAVPDQIPGATPEERRANYAELLATQVRLTFPTAVVADMVLKGAAPVAGAADVRDGVHTFLTTNQGKFEIGMEPVERYLVRANLAGSVNAPVLAQIKRLQRVYQITSTDQAFAGLLQHNLDSAYQITRYDAPTFVRSFQDALGGAAVAEQTYAKARSVYGAVLNIAGSYLTAQRALALGGDTNALILNPGSAGQKEGGLPVVAYPTLEGLFGSMDFCACDDCRSILSPAAYLVDLLQFIDCPAPQNQNPQAVLFARRPDLQYLPLTCENTNIALPYIDLVNETLEYFVANSLSLAGYAGHTTDGSTASAELLASPQFVNDAAYSTLQGALFPPPLPFHRPLELLRLHFQKFGLQLPDVMTALRPGDALERGAAAYGWRDILMEQLGLSRPEYQILTDSTLTLQQLYGYPGLSDAAVITALSGVQAFSRRVGVSYDDLLAILQTRFINPNATLIPRLERLGVPLTTLQALKDGTLTPAAFTALLPAGLDLSEYGNDVVSWVTNAANYARIMGLITIANPSNSGDLCSLAGLQFRYAKPDNSANTLKAGDFVRLLRFIRLRNRLGLTIEQTDTVLTALYPPADLPTGADEAADLRHLDSGFLTLLPRAGFLFQVLQRLQLRPDRDLPGLLACWGPIGTAGQHSLYRTLFLTPTLLQQDAAFAEDSDGNVLQDATQKLLAHEPALRAALNLTGAEFALIIGDLGFDATTPLSIDTISAIYRRGWLARALRLSMVEFLLLTRYSGLDPFTAPDPAPTPPIEPPVIRLIALVQALAAAALRPVQALYLLWNQDISGTSAPADAAVTALARTLRTDFAAIESQFALVSDPNGNIAKALMALVYGADAAGFFFGLLDNTLASTVAYANPQPALAQAVIDAAGGRLSYDDLRKQLTFSGVLDSATLAALSTAIGANAALQAAVTALASANHKAVDPFFAAYPELLPLYSAYAASSDPAPTKRTTLLANFLPDLKQRRKREQALSSLTAAAGADSSFATALLQDTTVMHAAADVTLDGSHDLTAVETPGLSAAFFLTNNPAAPPDLTVDAVPALSYAAGGANTLPTGQGGSAIAGIWRGYLDAPQDGYYNIAVTADAGAGVALTINGAAVAMAAAGDVWSNQSPISLSAGTLAPITLTATGLKSTLSVRWQSKGLGWQVIPPGALYPATLVERLRSTYVRYLKATALTSALNLTAAELAYLAADGDLQVNGQGWLNSLVVSGNPDPPTATSLRDVLTALLTFARLKAAIAPNDERLLAVLRQPTATLANGKSALLSLTTWEQGSLDALLSQFFGNSQIANLTHLESFRRVYAAYSIVTACGIPAAVLIGATTNDPTAATVSTLQAALRARYAEADWLAVVRPINDSMRARQRDALVAYVLQHLGDQPATSTINTPDKLFEYFLMDVEMDPCMETSRIRHALSSVQLYIERCLRNLEPAVTASDLPAAQWEWMKRYRVWEANRKVFLWPENWLEPELRDDQSPFFKETMSELLQSDITDDSAAAAFLNYLSKLEEVAKLEPCGIHYVPSDPGAANEVAHVVARTAGAHRKYYYRRLQYGTWTPWEQIKLDIEDTPVIPVVWNDRLLLFWLRILQQTPVDTNALPAPSSDSTPLTQVTIGGVQSAAQSGVKSQSQVTVQGVLCWSEYYNGKWQPTKTSDINRPTYIGSFDAAGQYAFDRTSLRLQAGYLSGLPAGTLVVQIGNSSIWNLFGFRAAGFLLYNTHSLPLRLEDVASPPYQLPSSLRLLAGSYPSSTTATFTIGYWQRTAGGTTYLTCDLLQTNIGERVTLPQPELADAWNAPFFFEDSRNVFYVTTDEAMVTIWDWLGYGVGRGGVSLQNDKHVTIPPLALPQQAVIPDRIGPVVTPTNPALGDPAALQRFVSDDANIRTALGTTAAVTYGASEIGPAGRLTNQQGV